MEQKVDLTSVLLMIGETNARLKELGEYLSKIDKKLSNQYTNTKKEIKSVLGPPRPVKTIFTVKRTVTDK